MDASLKLKTDGEFKMATIGTFSLAKDGFLQGAIKTLTLDTQATFEPVESESKGAPSFRLYAGDIELGAAWPKTARESGREYHQVRIDDPASRSPSSPTWWSIVTVASTSSGTARAAPLSALATEGENTGPPAERWAVFQSWPRPTFSARQSQNRVNVA